MEWFYITGYVAILLVVILKTGLFNRNGIDPRHIALLFILKVAVGILYGYLHKIYIPGGDTYVFFHQSKFIMRAWEAHPSLYFRLVFGPNNLDPIPPELYRFVYAMSNWTDSGGYMMVRINALFRLLSGGVDAYYNVHVVFISFLSLLGLYYIYLFFDQFISGKKTFLFVILFMIPSIIFWYSGVHKEGIVILSIGITLHNSRQLFNKGIKIKYIFGLGLGILLLGLIRFYLMALLLPLLMAYFTVKLLHSAKPVQIYMSVFFLSMICMAVLHWLVPEFSAIGEAAVKQKSFIKNTGDTTFSIPAIGSSYWRLLINIPYTILNPLIRPIPMDCDKVLCYIASAETYLLLIAIIVLLVQFRFRLLVHNNEALFCIAFSLLMLAIIGLIVNNAGAIVRYRSIVLPFLFTGLYLSSRFYEKNSVKNVST